MNLATHIRNFVFRVASGIRLKAKKCAPIRSGNLKKDIQVFEHSDYFTIGNSALAPYAKFVHFGTKPHIIKPKNKKALANVKSAQFFGKRVQHPGSKANPYLFRALHEYLKSSGFKSAQRALQKALKEEILITVIRHLGSGDGVLCYLGCFA